MRRLVLALLVSASIPLSAQTHSITHTYALGGDGFWDLVSTDAPRHRVFIGRSDRVMVVDMNDGHLIGEVSGIKGAHGVAIVPAINRGFATAGADSSIVMFDLRTYRTLGRIPAAEDADDILYDPASGRVFSFNGDANSATAVDPRKGVLIRNIPLGGKPEAGEAAGNGKIYINLVDSSEVVELDAKSLAVTRRWSTAPCKSPVAMAIDERRHRLFSGCRSGVLAVSDYRTGKVITTVPIGSGVDGAGYDPATRTIYTSNGGDGTLTVIHQDDADHYSVVENFKTAAYSRNMGLDRASHRIYLPAADFGPVDSTAGNQRRRPQMLPGTFKVLVVEPNGSH